jgi:hypothetical protein
MVSGSGCSVPPALYVIDAMPSLIRLLFALGMLSALAYGGIVSLATFVQPQQREMSVTIPQDRLNKHR